VQGLGTKTGLVPTAVTEPNAGLRHSEVMWRHPLLTLGLGLYIGWGAWNWLVDRPVHSPDGVLAADDPAQTNLPDGTQVHVGRWTLTERANYEITARILARERYRFDALSDLIPEDLALGWGPMSDNRNLQRIDISQGNRFYYWRVPARSALSRDAIITHSANTHVIPQDPLIAKQLSRLRPGQVVTLSGELVDGQRDDGRWIRTSMTRSDTGAGSCEVLLVTRVMLQ
jgi:hypothetical protein